MTESEALNILELRPEATQEQIIKAYHDLVMVWHPDRLPHDSRVRLKAEEKLKQINQAKQVLSFTCPR